MASRLRQKTTKSDRYEPAPRYYHQTVVIGGNLYMWAGSVDGLPRVHDSPEKRAFASLVDVFHLESGDWVQQLTSGTPPLGVYGYACAAVGDEVHYFGGDCGHRYCYHNSVHKLSTSSLQWVMLSPTISESDAPMKKAYCGMVAFCDGKEDILFVVGGGGTTPSSHQPGAQYEKLTDVRTISNEQHMFTLSTRKWSSPDINGEPPPPCDVFTLTPVSARRAALFGGDRGLEISPVSDLFIVDLSRHAVHWTKISKPCTGLSTIFRSLKWPEERYGHAATCVNGTLLVIMGGEINWKTMISDCWIYDITATLWKKLPLPDSVTKRRYHSLSTLQLSPQTVWLIVFGGQRSYGADPMFHTTTVELLQGRDGQWRVGKVMEGADLVRQYLQILSEGRRRGLSEENKSSVEHQLHQRVHQLEEEKRQIQQQQQQTRVRAAHEMEQVTTELLREKEQIQPQLETRTEKEQLRTESQLQTANTRADEEIRQLQLQVQQQQQQARVRASEMEQVTREKEQIQLQLNTRAEDLQLLKTEKEQLRTENKQLQTANTRADEQIRQLQLQVQQQQQQARVRASEMEQVMREKELIQQELQTANTRRIQSQQQIRQLQQQLSVMIISEGREEQPHWVVKREEVEISSEVVGMGGWGEVKVAKFRGLCVAAKCLYKVILSDYNLRQFTREMTIAAKLRHPNLLLFIGATREGEPVILTELMPTSLRRELERREMPRVHISSISQDVARALCYLHQWKPYPIIHRDISSGNVLLEPLPNGWRAKVSDYGSANFLNDIKTAGPGTPAYSAPEASFPHQHSPKMDTFSFGVLLVEICLRELPESQPEHREEQIQCIQWPTMVSLIRSCTSERSAGRPSMSDIMELLDRIQ